MDNLLNTMFIKRFCLPINTDVNSYETGKEVINNCLCGKFNHIACILSREIKWLEKG